MATRMRTWLAVAVLGFVGVWAAGQDSKAPAPVTKEPAPTPPAASVVAATVNSQSIPELAVFRALCQARPKDYDLARKEIVNYLIDNALIDQYLLQLKIEVQTKDIDDKVEQIKKEAKERGSEFDKILLQLHLTEPDLRKEMACALRWDRFVAQQATDKSLKELFDRNTNMFDGSQMQARHILVKLDSADKMTARVNQLRKQIEEEVAQEMTKVAAEFKTEKEQARMLEKIFSRTAIKESICPSKENGGDLGWFPRAGAMVEAFARTAFILKPYQMSGPVVTEFGCHLILATDLKPGKEVKFEDVKPFVQEVYSERLREAVIAAMRPQAKIVINPLMK